MLTAQNTHKKETELSPAPNTKYSPGVLASRTAAATDGYKQGGRGKPTDPIFSKPVPYTRPTVRLDTIVRAGFPCLCMYYRIYTRFILEDLQATMPSSRQKRPRHSFGTYCTQPCHHVSLPHVTPSPETPYFFVAWIPSDTIRPFGIDGGGVECLFNLSTSITRRRYLRLLRHGQKHDEPPS